LRMNVVLRRSAVCLISYLILPVLGLFQGSSVIVHDAWSFNNDVLNSEPPAMWMIMFFKPNCPGCQTTGPWFKAAAKELKSEGIKFGGMPGEKFPNFNKAYNITGYPTILCFLPGSPHPFPMMGLGGKASIVNFAKMMKAKIPAEFRVQTTLPTESKLGPRLELNDMRDFLLGSHVAAMGAPVGVLLLGGPNQENEAAPGWFTTVATKFKSGRAKQAAFGWVPNPDSARVAAAFGVDTEDLPAIIGCHIPGVLRWQSDMKLKRVDRKRISGGTSGFYQMYEAAVADQKDVKGFNQKRAKGVVRFVNSMLSLTQEQSDQLPAIPWDAEADFAFLGGQLEDEEVSMFITPAEIEEKLAVSKLSHTENGKQLVPVLSPENQQERCWKLKDKLCVLILACTHNIDSSIATFQTQKIGNSLHEQFTRRGEPLLFSTIEGKASGTISSESLAKFKVLFNIDDQVSHEDDQEVLKVVLLAIKTGRRPRYSKLELQMPSRANLDQINSSDAALLQLYQSSHTAAVKFISKIVTGDGKFQPMKQMPHLERATPHSASEKETNSEL